MQKKRVFAPATKRIFWRFKINEKNERMRKERYLECSPLLFHMLMNVLVNQHRFFCEHFGGGGRGLLHNSVQTMQNWVSKLKRTTTEQTHTNILFFIYTDQKIVAAVCFRCFNFTLHRMNKRNGLVYYLSNTNSQIEINIHIAF